MVEAAFSLPLLVLFGIGIFYISGMLRESGWVSQATYNAALLATETVSAELGSAPKNRANDLRDITDRPLVSWSDPEVSQYTVAPADGGTGRPLVSVVLRANIAGLTKFLPAGLIGLRQVGPYFRASIPLPSTRQFGHPTRRYCESGETVPWGTPCTITGGETGHGWDWFSDGDCPGPRCRKFLVDVTMSEL